MCLRDLPVLGTIRGVRSLCPNSSPLLINQTLPCLTPWRKPLHKKLKTAQFWLSCQKTEKNTHTHTPLWFPTQHPGFNISQMSSACCVDPGSGKSSAQDCCTHSNCISGDITVATFVSPGAWWGGTVRLEKKNTLTVWRTGMKATFLKDTRTINGTAWKCFLLKLKAFHFTHRTVSCLHRESFTLLQNSSVTIVVALLQPRVSVVTDYSPSSSSFTSLAAFSPSSLRFLSIILDLSAAALSSWLTVQPMVPSARFRTAA